MPFQYIYTSARRGLEPGKSGFCCVARDRDTPPDLQRELETLSRYESLSSAAQPIILRFRKAKLNSGEFCILSRIQDSGIDYSKRNNHIAHHLAFTAEEISSLPDPATLLLAWEGWKENWLEPPRILEARDAFDAANIDAAGISDAAASDLPPLVEKSQILQRSLLLTIGQEPAAAEWFRRVLLKLPATQRWSMPFTTCLLNSETPGDYAWSGYFSEQKLACEPILQPLPWASEANSPIKEDKPERQETEPETSATAGRPIVEIPQEINRSMRKRPKRRWTPKRVQRFINIAIAVFACVCLALGAYYIFRYKDVESDLFPSAAPENKEVTPIQNVQDSETRNDGASIEWIRLVNERQLIAQQAFAWSLAETLAQEGDPNPRQAMTALAQWQSGQDKVAIPSHLLGPEASGYRIAQEFAAYLTGDETRLAPKSLVATFISLQDLGVSIDAALARLSSLSFDAADTVLGLQSLRRYSLYESPAATSQKLSAAQAYLDAKEALLSSEKLKPYLEIQTAFKQEAGQGYLQFDEEGILANAAPVSYKAYALSLFENYTLPRYGQFESNASFAAALNALSDSGETLEAIYEAMLAGQPRTSQLALEWMRIKERWRETFIRDDLMEQALVDYALEQLEQDKAQLVKLQSAIQPEDLKASQRLERIEALFDEALKIASSASLEQEWVVFRSNALN